MINGHNFQARVNCESNTRLCRIHMLKIINNNGMLNMIIRYLIISCLKHQLGDYQK